MSIAVIADCHIGGPGGPPGPLVRQLDGLGPPRCERLLLLGDLFQVWIGSRRFEDAAVAEVVGALERLRGRGVGVDYVEGNRDFFLAEGPYAALFDRLAPELAFEAGGRRYLAVHGDGLDDQDRQYRFWRWLSKSRLSRWLMFRLPAGWTHRIAHRTERGLAGTNFKHKIRIPERAVLGYARRRLAEGFDAVLLGHFHRPRVWRLPGGEVRLLDAWFNDRAIHWFG